MRMINCHPRVCSGGAVPALSPRELLCQPGLCGHDSEQSYHGRRMHREGTWGAHAQTTRARVRTGKGTNLHAIHSQTTCTHAKHIASKQICL
jgi:hypothetical protein